MAGIPASLLRDLGQDVTVEAYSGVGVDGADAYAATVTVRALVEETDQTQRTEVPTGDQAVMAVLRCPLDTSCPSGSRVTLASGRIGTVTRVKRWDAGHTPAPSHLEVTVEGTVAA